MLQYLDGDYMGEDSLEKWYEEKIEKSPEEVIRDNQERIEKVFSHQNGEIIPVDTSNSTAKQIVSLAIGKGVAFTVGKSETESLNLQELYGKIDDKEKNIRANLSQERCKRFVEKRGKGEYRIRYAKIPGALDYILGDENRS